ncbi:MAG: cytidyltransferase-related domain protein [Oscillibacter sp.]|uniref:nicotinate-nicotinamide nucleotide adenylyltransferase n=1 Tax=Oscillibacter sp. TaxID=1945593 RepID=UPI002173A25F|nr:cytidyltransferase-related domain protein [Oscillibacter sp.]MCI8840963.1 cytidyltransferase-related domain protein [Oscillibacter sp.]MCI9113528.1 cytidyltransferase-related domain protein [Oscillibacter sp.]
MEQLCLNLTRAFQEEAFLQKLARPRAEALFEDLDWPALLAPLAPIEERISCEKALEAFRPVLDGLAPEPGEGWALCAYRTAVSLLYPQADPDQTPAQRDGALCFLQFLRTLFDAEREALPFDFWLDFAFCTEEELKSSAVAADYRQFLRRWREEYVYELLRLGREVTPFRTCEHIAGVHHVSMTVSRAFKAGGGKIDLGLISAAAAGHDIGKFGCRPGERVPYLHYYYTDQWFSWRGLGALGRIAANHSVWDLELENLSSESLVLVYADFRVKQERLPGGGETARLFSLADAFDVILSKLDNVDAAKRRRYDYVYVKLRDFEGYLRSFGVDVSLETAGGPPLPRKDPSLMDEDEVVLGLRRTAVDHNIRLMHRLSRERLFVGTLEAARGEKDPGRIRAYVSVFREYFTYWTVEQKEQTLEFLYELLLQPDGDIRRQAAGLMGRILSKFLSGYRKELPQGAAPSPQEDRPFELWAEYLEKLIHPDRRLTPRQISMIRYQAKTAADALLGGCSDRDFPRFSELLFRHYQNPAAEDAEGAFALMNTALNLPMERISPRDAAHLADYAAWWLETGEAPQKAAAMRLSRRLLPVLEEDSPQRKAVARAVEAADCSASVPLLYLQSRLGKLLGLDVSGFLALLDQGEAAGGVFLDNLKTATPWVLKAVGVEYLLDQARRGEGETALHIAAHFSNLMKVSENVVVRRLAGSALLDVAPMLTPPRRNEVAVELCEALETGQSEISQYIPPYLGQFLLWLTPRELDEILGELLRFLSSSSASVAAGALGTVGSLLEHYRVYAKRFHEPAEALERRRRTLAGLLLKGLASCMEPVRQEALRVLGEGLFASPFLGYQDKTGLFTLVAKKLLFLIGEQPGGELTFFHTAAALSHIYRFAVKHRIESGPFRFEWRDKAAAFFPGTFDPFSLSHKGIVTAIRDLGMEVYLAVDEFSWSKKAQPSLIRRQIVSMSVADEFDVYLFPHDIPVNLATPEDLLRLRQVFAGRELYLVVGSDVVANASSYKAPPSEGSVHSLNHIVFRRSSDAEGREIEADLSAICGRVVQLQLPTHLEDISSTRIRENIDLGRDVSNLVDPTVQDLIYRNGLYLREPQYKQLVRASLLDFDRIASPGPALWAELEEALGPLPPPDPRDSVFLLRASGPRPRILGVLTTRILNSGELYNAFGSEELANVVRTRTAGRLQLLTGLWTVKAPGGNYDAGQLLLTEVLTRAAEDDCGYAVWWGRLDPAGREMLCRQGFVPADLETPEPLLLVDMRSPAVLVQNISTTLKEPFASDKQVLAAMGAAHLRLQEAVCGLYPGTLVLSLNAEVIYHRLVRKLTEENGVPAEPQTPRVLGPKMCVPFGKILRGNAVPNTVTKTIHTDKVFAPDLHSFSIAPFPGYAPLESQIRTIRSFRRPVMLVDDLLHTGNRMNVLDPLFRREELDIDRCVVGLLSGRGRDLMAARGRKVDSVYFVPDLRAWFVESTMYPFIGGDAVDKGMVSVPGLTPAVNLILPYAFPRFYRSCGREAVFRFSRTCIENSREILLALERAYRERFSRNLTLSRLSEAVILPLSPDKGAALRYDPNLSASVCLESDLRQLDRMRELLK